MVRRAPKLLVLAIDIGTSSARSALFDQTGRHLSETTAQQKYSVHYADDGGAELSADVLAAATRRCLRQTLAIYRKTALLRRTPIAAVGGSGFWHSLLGLDAKGNAVTPVFTWADSRSETAASLLRREFSERAILARTGCMLRFCYWPAKLLWLRRRAPRTFARIRRWVSPADFIFEKLFGTNGTSESMASATGLFDQRRRTWDRELCRRCRIPLDRLPSVPRPPAILRRGPAELKGALVFSPLGDGAASHLALGDSKSATVGISVGTSAAARVALPRKAAMRLTIPNGLFRYAIDENRFVLGGAISNAGNLRNWCFRELRISPTKLARSAAASDSLTLLPSWVEERSPTWPPSIGGTIVGLKPATTADDLYRAATTATFNRLTQVLDLLESCVGRVPRIVLSAGITRSDDSVRLLADVLGRDLEISPELEMSLRGAALHALAGVGAMPARLRKGRMVRHDRKFARQHQARRQKQIALENLIESFADET